MLFMKTECALCGKEIERQPCRIRKGNCYCSNLCQLKYEYEHGIRDRKKIVEKAHQAVRKKGELKFKQNPTTKISKRGYLMIYVPLNNEGWTKYHHWVWRINYGDISKGMVIHHINMDKLDNNIDNLQMMPSREHLKLHDRLRKRNKKGQYQ